MLLRSLCCFAVCFTVVGCKPKNRAGRDAAPPVADKAAGPSGAGEAGGVTAPPVPAGVKYVPGESEKKLQDYLDGLENDAARDAVTDTQVYAIMGEPTRRGPSQTFQRNGQTFTIYDAYWEVPGSGVKSETGFMDGRLGGGGMVLGLVVPKR